MEFSIVEGKKLNSINYLSNGYRYVKYHENKGTIYLRCALAKKSGCGALAKVSTSENLLNTTKHHDHSQNEHNSESISLANQIKRAAEVSSENLREVFNTECRNSPGASSLTFKNMQSTLSKRRKLQVPKLPSSAEEFDELLAHSPYSSNYRLTIKDGSDIAVVFATDQMISKIKEIEVIHFDATFKVVPRIFYQLSTIFIRVKGHAIPALHILMTAKNEQLYRAVISAVRTYIPEFNPSIVMCDFEKASRNAFISVFPYANIVGCWFHFTKAVYDKVQKLGLGKLYRVNKEFKNWIHLLMSLPFLPEEEIRPTYLAIHLPLIGLTESELKCVEHSRVIFRKSG